MTEQIAISVEEAFQIAHERAVWVDLNSHGRLVATDRDRLDLLHRLSTNNLTKLAEGQFAPTVFTTPNARVIDYVTVLHRGEEALLVTGEEHAELMLNWLRRNVFFNDKFQIRDASTEVHQLGVFGARAKALLAAIWPQVNRLANGQFVDVDDLLIAPVNNIGGAGYWLIGTPDALQIAQEKFASNDIPLADHVAYEALRIEAGVPSTQAELTENYIPLELGLWDAVSFNKGCYTGQEIIARMESRGKLAKLLARVNLGQSIPVGTSLVDSEGKSAGTLTSVAGPVVGRVMGLAVVKAAYATPDQELFAALEDGNSVRVSIVSLAGKYEANFD